MRRAEYPDVAELEAERHRREIPPPVEYPEGPTAWWLREHPEGVAA